MELSERRSDGVPASRRGRRRWWRRPQHPDAALRLAAVYGLGVMMVAVPAKALAGEATVAAPSGAIAAVAAGHDRGFVLYRDGAVGRFGTGSLAAATGDAAIERVAEVGPYRTPFGTTVAGRAVFGGLRCAERGCDERFAEVAVLDGGGHPTTLVLERTAGWPSALDGVLLVGGTGPTLWVGAGGALFEVRATLPQPEVVEEVPWPGGEPCVVGGVLHDLAASAGTYGDGGVSGAAPVPFRLRLSAWDGTEWRPVTGATRAMAYGLNAHCTPGGYEIRAGDQAVERWEPGAGWFPLDAAAPPPAWCTTAAERRDPSPCGRGPGRRGPSTTSVTPLGSPDPAPTEAPEEPVAGRVHHYNLCSAACGRGVRPHSRDVVAGRVASETPAALSLNEVCYDDVAHLAHRLPTYAVAAGYVALATATNCPGAVKQFGNQLLVHRSLGPTTGWWAQFSRQAATPCDRRAQECRGVACSATRERDGAAGDVAAAGAVYCTAHLESPRHGDDVAARQAAEYVALVADRHGSQPARFLAGDFNLVPADVDALLHGGGYRSATTEPTLVDGSDPQQIDMIYGSTPAGGAADLPPGTTHCDIQASDHCYLAAVWPDW